MKIGNGGGGVKQHGGQIILVKLVIFYGINMKMKLKHMKEYADIL